jgi:hypothetical protein
MKYFDGPRPTYGWMLGLEFSQQGREHASNPQPRENRAGFWHLLRIIIGRLRLIYIPSKLFVHGDATATVDNIAAHEWLFRFGMVSELVGAVMLILLTLAFYRLFAGVDRNLALQVVIFGGVMPSVIYFVNVVTGAGAVMVAPRCRFLVRIRQTSA